MSKVCLRWRADPRSTRERRGETIPFGFTSRQAEAQPARLIRKNSRPDFRLREPHLRRLGGRYAIHSCSKRGYDEHMTRLVRSYLADGADPALPGFLRLNFAQLQARHAHVEAIVVPRPKLVPVPARKAADQGASRGAAREGKKK